MNFRGDNIWTWHWTLTTIKERVLLDPVHEKKANNSEERNDWLKRNKETHENEVVNEINILESYLKLHLLAFLVEFELTKLESSF